MKNLILAAILFISIAAYSQSDILPPEIQIKTALLAAPTEERSGAMVYGYDKNGKMVVLKEGTNNMVCIADNPDFDGVQVACYSKKLEPFMARGRQLSAEGKSEIEKRKIRKEEVESGKLKMPDAPSTLYVFAGSDEKYDKTTGELKDGKFRYVIYIPYATTESTGLPAKPEAPGMPWLMDPGTHRAHIMISPANN
ncbi:hypothetical protein [Christiangramia crocea]|uniref:Uncharacterized protein n=1 Tax=Christiangramia crocea TaxID=2904124 RepID=A0A9X1UZ52_9FLAO|nr:hypothetical protein [Gramella crocea]MCG9972805.1 hypothetical protein [Gramella crocea]